MATGYFYVLKMTIRAEKSTHSNRFGAETKTLSTIT